MSNERASLREITKESLGAVLDLTVTSVQQDFVASNAVSLAQALFSPEMAWYRAIHAGDEPVAFAMFALEEGEAFAHLWRFMIDHRRQRRGHGRRAMELLGEEMRGRGHEGIRLTFVDAEGGPEAFYAPLGFRRTGRVVKGETEMELRFEEPGGEDR